MRRCALAAVERPVPYAGTHIPGDRLDIDLLRLGDPEPLEDQLGRRIAGQHSGSDSAIPSSSKSSSHPRTSSSDRSVDFPLLGQDERQVAVDRALLRGWVSPDVCRETRMSGSMSGTWRRSYGRATEAPPDERGGNRHA